MTQIQAQPAGRPSKSSLIRLRAGLRRVAVLEVVTAGVGIALALLLAEGLIDYLLRLPAWLRGALLVVGVAALILGIRKHLMPAIRLRPKLSTLALRVEKSELGKTKEFGGVLASGVELGEQSPEADEPESIGWLRTRAAMDADSRAKGANLNTLIHTGTLRHNIFGLLLAVTAVGLIAFFAPQTAGTGLSRALMPWSDASWPKRTELTSVTETEAHALGSALPLRAVVTRTNRPVGKTPVEVVYRIITEEGSTPLRTEPLTGQESFESLSDGSSGEAYERLIEPSITLTNAEQPATLEYYFQTPDDRTETQRVLLVEPPRVVLMTASIEPPTYAPMGAASASWISGETQLGEGQDERAVLGPVLAGSKVTVTTTLNKAAALGEESFETAETVPSDLSFIQNGNVHTITWTSESRARLRLSFTDDLGITSVDDAFVRLESLQDRPPSVTVTVPERDEAVLASAIVDFTGEARDDVGLSWIELRSQLAKVPGSATDSPGATPEAVGEPEQLVRLEAAELRAQVEHTIDLSTLDLNVGDALYVTAVAGDVFSLPTELGLVRTHGETASAIRTLHIISESELVEQILSELGGIRRTAARLDEQQSELIQQLRTSRESREQPAQSMARDQAALTDALDRLGRTTEQLRERTERNGLDDASLEDLLARAQQTIDEAGDESERAASELNAASQEENAERRAEPETNAEEAQQRVRRAMEDLSLLLDRGEDSWAVRQALEGLLDDQQQLAQDTAEIGRQTVGKSQSQLSQEEMTELDRIAQRQLELADRASDLLDELDDKSREMQETDPGQSTAMRAAARRGREQGVPQSLQRASDSVQSNNTTDAGRQQQQAMDQLGQMLEDLEEAEEQRDQELKRALLSIIESVEALIRTQQSELAALVRTNQAAGEVSQLTGGMASLHRNTLAVIDEASQSPETVRVAGLLGEAASAQTDAIISLDAGDGALAERHEETSLTRLEAALEEAQEELDNAEDRERERRKEELKAAYTEALTMQVSISEQTLPLVKDRLSRRERADARDLGRLEQELRESLRQIPASYEEILSAGVFDFAHTRIDTQLDDIGTSFVAGKVERRHARQQASVESLLRGLIEALEDPEQSESEFADGGSGEGSQMQPGDQQEELIPPIAELRLLRAMQQDLLDQTRMIEDFGSTPEEARAIGDLQDEIASQGEVLIEKMKQQQGEGDGIPMPPPEVDQEGGQP